MSLEENIKKPYFLKLKETGKDFIQKLPYKAKKAAKEYPRNFGNILLKMGPSFIVAINGAKIAGEFAENIPEISINATNALTYLGGTIGGYGTFYAQEFVTNRDEYPKIASKEFLHFCATFAMYDYVADAVFYTPEFWIINDILLKNGADAGSSGTLASLGAGLIYMGGSAIFYEKTHELSTKSIECLKKKISKKPKIRTIAWCLKDLLETSIEAYSPVFKPAELILDYVGNRTKSICSKINNKYPVLSKKVI